MTIRNFLYEKEKFKIDVNKFASMLKDKNSSEYLFKNVDFHNVPIDGLAIYMK